MHLRYLSPCQDGVLNLWEDVPVHCGFVSIYAGRVCAHDSHQMEWVLVLMSCDLDFGRGGQCSCARPDMCSGASVPVKSWLQALPALTGGHFMQLFCMLALHATGFVANVGCVKCISVYESEYRCIRVTQSLALPVSASCDSRVLSDVHRSWPPGKVLATTPWPLAKPAFAVLPCPASCIAHVECSFGESDVAGSMDARFAPTRTLPWLSCRLRSHASISEDAVRSLFCCSGCGYC